MNFVCQFDHPPSVISTKVERSLKSLNAQKRDFSTIARNDRRGVLSSRPRWRDPLSPIAPKGTSRLALEMTKIVIFNS
ncbi:MAG: hypothetical protein BWY14_00042 [Parcubacteria group bacterium ADurb.Bin192]|nr:MAG: hypothetical protein BWY14_00042 [Parcubacteria group bacterium ADurb.Bin192]